MILKKLWWLGMAVASTLILMAQDRPADVLKATTSAPAKAQQGVDLQAQWRTFVNAQQWGDAVYSEGVMLFENRDLIVASGSAFVGVGLGQPGWIESRIAAFEQAELNAKIKIIRFLSEGVDAGRSLTYLENSTWHDGDIREIHALNDVGQTLKRIGKKTLDLADASLDQALQKIDPDYDKERYERMPVAEKHKILEQTFKRTIRNVTFKTTIGITLVYNNEAQVDGAYQVIVGMVWSPKLNRLAQGLFNQIYALEKASPSKSITEILKDSTFLLSTYGTRITIDEHGDFIVLAYAQAAPRIASPNRHPQAIHDAKAVAANRARALIVHFIQEGLAYSSSEQSQELLREFSDQTAGVEMLRKITRKIRGHKTHVRLRGLRQVKEWAEKHPVTGQWVTGVVMAWSPGSMEASRTMTETMRARAHTDTRQKASMPKSKSVDLSSVPVNTSAY